MAKDNFFWRKNSNPSLSGLVDHEGRKRTMESRTIEHPDGRKETVYTVVEDDYRTSYISATNAENLRIGTEAYVKLKTPLAEQNTPLHHLTHMKNEMMSEMIERLRLSGSTGNTVLQLKAKK